MQGNWSKSPGGFAGGSAAKAPIEEAPISEPPTPKGVEDMVLVIGEAHLAAIAPSTIGSAFFISLCTFVSGTGLPFANLIDFGSPFIGNGARSRPSIRPLKV